MTRMLCAVAALLLLRHTRCRAGAARVDRRNDTRQFRRRAAGRDGRSAESVARRRRRRTVTDSAGRHTGFRRCRPASYEIDARRCRDSQPCEVPRCPARARARCSRSTSRCRRPACPRPSRSPASRRSSTSSRTPAGANVQAEIDRAHPEGPRLRRARDLGARRSPSEARNRGIQIDGASGADNRFMIDGVDTTEPPLNGTSGKPLPPTSCRHGAGQGERLQRPSTARRIGGVISAITKSGGNQYHGSAGIYYTGDRTCTATCAPTLRLNPSEHDDSRVRRRRRSTTSLEPGADLRSRRPDLKRDRLWFYVGYNPSWTETHADGALRTAPAARHVQPEADRSDLSTTTSPARSPGTCAAGFAASNQRDEGGYGAAGIRRRSASAPRNPALFPIGHPHATASTTRTPGVIDWVVNNKTYVNLTTTRFNVRISTTSARSATALRHVFQGPRTSAIRPRFRDRAAARTPRFPPACSR